MAEDEALQGVPLSIDTFYAEVAREAVAAGAHIVNDVSGGSLDPAMHKEVTCHIPHMPILACPYWHAHTCLPTHLITAKAAFCTPQSGLCLAE